MDFRTPIELGRSGLRAARMGVGADSGIDSAALEWAFEQGVNYFYWGSRRSRGMRDAIRHLAPRHRERLVIALQSYDFSGWSLEWSIRRALRKLRIEYADVLILGKRDDSLSPRARDGALSLRERGLVRHLCVSAHERGAYAGHLSLGIFDLLMVRYNCAHTGAEREVFPLVEGRPDRPGVIAYNSTRWGHLFDPAFMPPGEVTPEPTHLYRHVLSHPAVDMVLTAPRDRAELAVNLRALEQGPLDPEEQAWLARVGKHVHDLSPHGNWDFLFQTFRRPRGG